MQFRRYEKIHRLGKEETDGILDGVCTIQEKLDGANASIWIGEDGVLHCGSRSRDLTAAGDGFQGFCAYVEGHEGINKLLSDWPKYRLYGEWLVYHTLQYPETAYQRFYLFDIHDGERFLEPSDVEKVASEYGVDCVETFDVIDNPTVDELKEIAGRSVVGDKGEGIVIKNPNFINIFGEPCNAKIVTEEFKENNGVTFGGNNKHSETYWEMYIVNKYMTLARIRKVMNKIQPLVDHRLHLADIPRITTTAYQDMLTEEIWEIAKKVGKVDFKSLKRIANKKCVQTYKDILNNDISVADQDGV